jgi:flagellar hook assembly protein FlgD
MGARRCQKQQQFRSGAEIDRFWADYTRQNKHDGEKTFLKIFVAMLKPSRNLRA